MSTVSVKNQAIARAVAFLQAAGAFYRILDEKGEEVANTLPVEPEQKKRAYRHVGYAAHYQPLLKPYEDAGGPFSVDIPVPPEFEPAGYRSALAAHLCTKFGRGVGITHVDNERRVVEVIVART